MRFERIWIVLTPAEDPQQASGRYRQNSYQADSSLLRMDTRRTLYVAGFVGASISYIFNVLAFTGQFDLFRWAVFVVIFLVVFVAFERFILWAETLES